MLGLAVNHFGLGRGLRVLYRGFLASLCLQPGLLDLLLLERQRVLHGVGLRLGLQDANLRVALGVFHFADFLRLRLEFGDAHLLLLDLGLKDEAVVLLLLQQESFEPLGVLLGQLDVAHHHFLH